MHKETISIPKEVFKSMVKAYHSWAEFLSEFEDFVLASDKEFLSKMRKARKDHKEGKVKDLRELRRSFGV